MAGVVDFTDLKVQRHWYKLRDQFEHELRSATDQTRKDYDVSIMMNSATISTEGGHSALRVPISARWRDAVEQTIAYLVVTDVVEDEPRVLAVAHGVAELLDRWVHEEIPIRSAPTFLYPESEVRWPNLPQSTVQAAAVAKEEPAKAG